MTFESQMIVLGALAGGFVNGLTGFGMGLAGLPFWLTVVSPPVAAQVAAACGASGQAQTLGMVWRHIRWERALPLLAGGLLGVPAGTALLPHLTLATFKLGVGLVLVGYCSFMLATGVRKRSALSSPVLDGAVGVLGGMLAGVAGLSGPIPVIYASLLGWTKEERRGVFQIFNGAILVVALISSAIAGLATRAVLEALLLAVPAAFVGVWVGARVYRRLDDRRFDRIVLGIMIVSGVFMVVESQGWLAP